MTQKLKSLLTFASPHNTYIQTQTLTRQMQSLHRKTRLVHSNNPTGELINALCPKFNALLRLNRIRRNKTGANE